MNHCRISLSDGKGITVDHTLASLQDLFARSGGAFTVVTDTVTDLPVAIRNDKVVTIEDMGNPDDGGAWLEVK